MYGTLKSLHGLEVIMAMVLKLLVDFGQEFFRTKIIVFPYFDQEGLIKLAYELTEQFPPVSLLQSYLNLASKASPSKSGNTSNSQNDIINEKELNALKAVIKCIEDHKLDEQYPIAKQSLVPPSLSPVTREVDMPALATNVNLETTREASSIHSTDLDTIDAKTKEGQTQYSSNPSGTMSLEGDPRMALLMIEKRA
nr:FRIGIDA-like protein 3 [Ipomoea batatas]